DSIVPPFAALISRTATGVSEAQLPLTAQDSSYHPTHGHAYERMPDSSPQPQQQQQQRSDADRYSFDEDDEGHDEGDRKAAENSTSALERREGGVELRILPAARDRESV
ncbi:MAG: hypothetical protein LQ346_007886, partial [Caloplaca aetnensis]